jgi:anti-sigma regulatory factor (Ser/Thr protein kinase)
MNQGGTNEICRTLSLTVRNELAEIAGVQQSLAEFIAQARLPAYFAFDFTLAVDELLTNIISYGYEDSRVQEIKVRLLLLADRLELEIEDGGRAFNPLTATEPDLRATLEERAVGGLGLYLVRQKMDHLAYRRAAGKNVLTLAKRLPVTKGAESDGMS